MDLSGALSLSDEASQPVDLELLEPDDIAVESGPARQSKALWMKKQEILIIKLAFGAPPFEALKTITISSNAIKPPG